MSQCIERDFYLFYISTYGVSDLSCKHTLSFNPYSKSNDIEKYLKEIFTKTVEPRLPHKLQGCFSIQAKDNVQREKLTKLDERCHRSTALTLIIQCYAILVEYYGITPTKKFKNNFYNRFEKANGNVEEIDRLITFGAIDFQILEEADRNTEKRKIKAAINQFNIDLSINVGGVVQKRNYFVIVPRKNSGKISSNELNELVDDSDIETVTCLGVRTDDEAIVILFGFGIDILRSQIHARMKCVRKWSLILTVGCIFLCFFALYMKFFLFFKEPNEYEEKYRIEIIQTFGVNAYQSILRFKEPYDKESIKVVAPHKKDEEIFWTLRNAPAKKNDKYSILYKCYLINKQITKAVPLTPYLRYIETDIVYNAAILFSPDLEFDTTGGDAEKYVMKNLARKDFLGYVYILPNSKMDTGARFIKESQVSQKYPAKIKILYLKDEIYEVLCGKKEVQILVRDICNPLNCLISFDDTNYKSYMCLVLFCEEIRLEYLKLLMRYGINIQEALNKLLIQSNIMQTLGDSTYQSIAKFKSPTNEEILKYIAPNMKGTFSVLDKIEPCTTDYDSSCSVLFKCYLANQEIAKIVQLTNYLRYIEGDQTNDASILFTPTAEYDIPDGEVESRVITNLKRDEFKIYTYIFPKSRQKEIERFKESTIYKTYHPLRKVKVVSLENETYNVLCGGRELQIFRRRDKSYLIGFDIPPPHKSDMSLILLCPELTQKFIELVDEKIGIEKIFALHSE